MTSNDVTNHELSSMPDPATTARREQDFDTEPKHTQRPEAHLHCKLPCCTTNHAPAYNSQVNLAAHLPTSLAPCLLWPSK